MKTPFNARAPSFDADAINATIQRALASAGLDTSAGTMHGVTETIRRALASTGMAQPTARAADPAVVDVVGRFVPAGETDQAAVDGQPAHRQARPQPGRFETHSFSCAAGTRAYKLYVPTAATGGPRPLVVMLHGCTQSADDFATGTQMNRLADDLGFLVVYPEQTAQANASTCWNWFQPQDQQRGAGEPSLLAGIVREVVQRQGADAGRIFVAGLSAGAAMAVVLGQTYPELFAGVGAHSGLPYASAHDIPSALAAMKGGRSGMRRQTSRSAVGSCPQAQADQAVPVIVFHGDRDHMVQQTNGEHIVQQARQAHGAQAGEASLRATTQTGVAPGGRRFSRTVHSDAAGQAWIESWVVHGAGHAWSGGHANGSYTDANGPDASAEMVRFFMALPRAGAA